MDRKKVLVAFGDIRGFTVFTRRAMNAPEEKGKMIARIYALFEHLSLNPRYHFKYTGDGFMVLLEINARTRQRAVHEFLRDVYFTAVRVQAIVEAAYPRPDGFRVRVTCGMSFKMLVRAQPYGWTRRGKFPEYVDYPVSLADRLLEVYAAEHLCILHESVLPTINVKASGIILERLAVPKKCPADIDREDLAGLRSFRFDDKAHGGARAAS